MCICICICTSVAISIYISMSMDTYVDIDMDAMCVRRYLFVCLYLWVSIYISMSMDTYVDIDMGNECILVFVYIHICVACSGKKDRDQKRKREGKKRKKPQEREREKERNRKREKERQRERERQICAQFWSQRGGHPSRRAALCERKKERERRREREGEREKEGYTEKGTCAQLWSQQGGHPSRHAAARQSDQGSQPLLPRCRLHRYCDWDRWYVNTNKTCHEQDMSRTRHVTNKTCFPSNKKTLRLIRRKSSVARRCFGCALLSKGKRFLHSYEKCLIHVNAACLTGMRRVLSEISPVRHPVRRECGMSDRTIEPTSDTLCIRAALCIRCHCVSEVGSIVLSQDNRMSSFVLDIL